MELISPAPLSLGPLPHVLDRQAYHQNGHLGEAAPAVSLDHHAAHPRVHRQVRELPPDGGDAASAVQCAQLLEQAHRIGDRFGVGLLDEGEVQELGGVRTTPIEDICSSTDANEVRRISGSVNSGRDSKSSCEYRRMHMPGLVRPARPAR